MYCLYLTKPRGRVSFYNTENLKYDEFSKMLSRDEDILRSAEIDYSIECDDENTYLVVDWCSEYELAEELLS